MNLTEAHNRSEPAPLSTRSLLTKTIIGIVAFMGIMTIPITIHRDWILEFCRTFVERAGGPGVFVGFMIPDMIPIPFSQDIFTGMAVLGGMSMTEAVSWAVAGSLVGGSIGFSIGRMIKRSARVRRFLEGRGARAYELVRERGSIAVIIGAVTPIPYSVICWACGALDYPYGRLMLISLLRIPRIALYLYLIDAGLSWIIGL